MKRYWKKLWTLVGFGILSAFLSFLFVASVGGRSDGREIPFPVGVLNDPGCYVTGCHMVPGSTLNEVGSVSFDKLPETIRSRRNLRPGNHDHWRNDVRVPGSGGFFR